MEVPCNKCPDRKQACHTTCEKYKAWKQEWNRTKEAKEKSESVVRNIIEAECALHRKLKRRMK